MQSGPGMRRGMETHRSLGTRQGLGTPRRLGTDRRLGAQPPPPTRSPQAAATARHWARCPAFRWS